MKRLYFVLAFALLVLGTLHTVVALLHLKTTSAPSVWFLSGGIAMLFAASLNFLNRAYGRALAPGVRSVTIAANLVMLLLSILAGYITHARPLDLVVVLSITGGLTLLSSFRQALT